ncbi:MAG: hypothetical protein HRF49_10305 [bacterium]
MRVYADTSVFGAIADTEPFALPSMKFFELVKEGAFNLVVSPTLDDEIAEAPLRVRKFYETFKQAAEVAVSSGEVYDLKDAYIANGILTPKWEADAIHVASATVSRCRLIVSWNFRHIVNFKKIRMYNAVNLLRGYQDIAIHTPQEVVESE